MLTKIHMYNLTVKINCFVYFFLPVHAIIIVEKKQIIYRKILLL